MTLTLLQATTFMCSGSGFCSEVSAKCIVLIQRWPTAGLPPGVLLLSGVLFSQSLMRPATPVFITAASCLDNVKGQPSLVITGSGAEQEGPVNWALSCLSVLLSLIHTEGFNNFLTSCTTFTFFLFFFTLNVLPPLPGELNTLPFSHMLLMFRMLSVTMGRSTAPERGDRDSLFSLWGDRNLGFKLR